MSEERVRCGIVGYPLDHTRSPELHHAFAEQCGVAQTYAVLPVLQSDFEQAVRGFFTEGGRGLNVTLPYKQRALVLADTATGRAARAGAANVLMRLDGDRVQADNVDGIGFLKDLDRLQFDPRKARVCVLGAGGAATGVIAALLGKGVDEVAVLNRSPWRAEDLIARLDDERLQPFAAKMTGFDLMVNATSASLANQCPDFPKSAIGPDTLAYDLVYAEQPTPFMQRAELLGARVCDGWGMLVEQAAESFYLWHGIRPHTSSLLGSFLRPG